MLGHDSHGSDGFPIIVLNDWLDDTTSWAATRHLLDPELRWLFVDLRGYGRSRDKAGAFTVIEAAADIIALADALHLKRFAIVGHSMSSLVALHLGQRHPERIERVVVITPPPPQGQGADEAAVAQLEGLARAEDLTRQLTLRLFWGDRLGDRWIVTKADNWRRAADPEAVAGYAAMFARDGLPDLTTRLTMPLLAITGEEDAEPMRAAPVRVMLAPFAHDLRVEPIRDSGHYPMQETPALLAAHLNRYFADL